MGRATFTGICRDLAARAHDCHNGNQVISPYVEQASVREL
jgi:hypothetical protein